MRAVAGSPALTRTLFAVYLLLLVGVVMFKLPFYAGMSGGTRVVNLVPFAGSVDAAGHLVSSEPLYNVLIFVPLGIYASMLSESAVATRLLLIVGSTVTLETAQYVLAVGVADVTDVITNTAGGIIGLGLHAVVRTLFRRQTVRAVNTIALVLSVLVVLRFAQLLVTSYAFMGLPPR